MDQSAIQPIVVELDFSKETKNTEVFSTDDRDAAVNQLYVDKAALKAIGNPRAVRITIQPLEQ